MCCYRYTRLQFTSSEDLDQITLSGEAVFHEVIEGNCFELLAVDQFLEGVQVDAFVLDAVWVRETELRYPALKRLLTPFKTDFALVAGTRLRAFVTTRVEVPPCPDPSPRPTRLRCFREPSAGLRLLRFMANAG